MAADPPPSPVVPTAAAAEESSIPSDISLSPAHDNNPRTFPRSPTPESEPGASYTSATFSPGPSAFSRSPTPENPSCFPSGPSRAAVSPTAPTLDEDPASRFAPGPSRATPDDAPSSSPPHKRPKIVIDDWVFEREFTYKDYVFQSTRNPRDYFDVLSDVTDSRNPGGNGLCRFYSVCDVAQTRMKILEATLPAKRGRFFGHRFGDRLSVTQLIDADLPYMQDFFRRLVNFGLTSEDQYRVKVSENRDFRGFVKYRFSDFKEYKGFALYPTEEMMEKSFDEVYFGLDNPCIKQISRFGPVLGTYDVPSDHELLTKVPLFRSTSSSSKTFDTPQGKRVVKHCVMIIGYGLALHVPTKEKIPYYCFQDNRGQEKDRSAFGRMPCDRFTWAYAPTHVEQCDLTSYRKFTDAEMRLVTREAAEYAVAHMG